MVGTMATWGEIEHDVPDFAAEVLARFAAGANATLATLRRDGAPRISGTEVSFDAGTSASRWSPVRDPARKLLRRTRPI